MSEAWQDRISGLATGIGTVPFLDTKEAVSRILKNLPGMPFWPQMVQVSPDEDMLVQYREGLPLQAGKSREENLTEFYQHYLAENLEAFALSPALASGWYAFIEALESRGTPGPFLKGQVVGPITLASALKGPDGKSLLYDPEYLQVLSLGLGMKGAWQAKKLVSLGAVPVIFIDEPALSGYGSAFFPVSEDQVLASLGETIKVIKEKSGALVGLHCCGNSDWAMLMKAPLDILSLDTYGFGDQFILASGNIRQFLDQGKVIAWGLIPTVEFQPGDSPEKFLKRMEALWEILIQQGVPRETLTRQAIFTPACGLGSLSLDQAEGILEILPRICDILG